MTRCFTLTNEHTTAIIVSGVRLQEENDFFSDYLIQNVLLLYPNYFYEGLYPDCFFELLYPDFFRITLSRLFFRIIYTDFFRMTLSRFFFSNYFIRIFFPIIYPDCFSRITLSTLIYSNGTCDKEWIRCIGYW